MLHGIRVVKEAVVIVEKLEKIRKIMKAIYRVRMKWYYALLCGFSQILDGLSLIITLGHWSTDLSLKVALLGARKSLCVVTPVEEAPTKKPIEYVDRYNRFHIDGDGDPLDDYGTGLGGQSMQEKRFCKGCHADVTGSMYCHCGDFQLLKEETLTEEELNKLENGNG
jgi:hypothetical protein